MSDFSNNVLSDLIHTRLIDRLAYAHDASIYRVVPIGVVRPRNEADVIALLHHSNDTKTPITFRTAGTSLSGQSIGPGYIAETVRDWKQWKILDQGQAIGLQPGVIGAHANSYLASYNRKIGPDPASIDSCMIGGIVANNSSGMACGVENNTYHTMRSIRFIVPDGKIYDTARRADYQKFVVEQYPLVQGIKSCQKQLKNNPTLNEKIRHKYRIKNTLGYGLNALIDYEHPLDVFAHLLVGSEGTLAFISEVVLNTIPDPPYKSTGLVIFDSMISACAAVQCLSENGAIALEVMDHSSLQTVKYLDYRPFDATILAPGNAGLLCEFASANIETLSRMVKTAESEIEKVGGQIVAPFSADAVIRERLWKLRKGLYPTVGAMRVSGTSVITEDICVDPHHLPQVVDELHAVFRTWNYPDAVVFGHAKDGNLHFTASIDLNHANGTTQLDGMMKDLVDITVRRFNGSLKAEHGTGRNMAPFVQTEWGGVLYEMMWQIKSLADPNHILNPGVLLNDNVKTHLQNLKPMPLVASSVDLCVECGFCESVCPSRDVTLTPRQRIVIAREIQYPERTPVEIDELTRDFTYAGMHTCATDGLCAVQCPVNIDTGAYIKVRRSGQHSLLSELIASFSARYFSLVQRIFKIGAHISHFIGQEGMQFFIKTVQNADHSSQSPGKFSLPTINTKINTFTSGCGEPFIYFPSCIHRMFRSDNNRSLISDLMAIAEPLSVALSIPQTITTMCCGMPFASKGYDRAHQRMVQHTIDQLFTLSNHGELPILIDMSPCSYHIKNLHDMKNTNYDLLQFVDLTDFLYERKQLLAQYNKLRETILIHQTCSGQKMQHQEKFTEVVKSMAKNVITAAYDGCCGTAGDKGIFYPEMVSSASQNCANAFPEYPATARGVSNSRMCAVSMSAATGVKFDSIISLVYETLTQ